MKILWVVNMLPPMVANELHMKGSNKEGWITGALMRMMDEVSMGESDMALSIAYPVNNPKLENLISASLDTYFEVDCYGYYEDQTRPEKYCLTLENRFAEIIEEDKPDIIHVFGTEYGHTLAVAKVVDSLNKAGKKVPKLLIGLQGIIYRCGEEYTCDLPEEVVNDRTFRDILKHDNIAEQQAKFLERGEMEKEALRLATDVTGRTDFDRESVFSINPKLHYHFMNETLRTPFYEGTWDITACRRHTIFVSQADYALKGFHILLEAMPIILESYADAKIVVAGADITDVSSFKKKIKLSGYGRYLNNIIHSYHLEDKVSFTGKLNAEQMKEQFLNCHTYVCPSSIENSPNSMGEAMLLGVPVVASRVGGIPSMINEDEEGRLFEAYNSEGLAADIIAIWKDDAYATELGANAMNRARLTHDADANFLRLMAIYDELLYDRRPE